MHRSTPEEVARGRLADLDDSWLLARTLGGDPNAFEILMNRYLPMVTTFLRSRTHSDADVEDLSQEIFLSAYRYLDGLRASDHFGPWVMRITRSKLIDFYRREGRSPRVVVSVDEENREGRRMVESIADASETPAGAAAHSELHGIVAREIGRMGDRLRTVLSMRLLAELSVGEIAREVGLKENTVRARICRGMKILRKALRKAGIHPEPAG